MVITVQDIPVLAGRYSRMHWSRQRKETVRWMRLILHAVGKPGPWPKIRAHIGLSTRVRWVPAGAWPLQKRCRVNVLVFRQRRQDKDNEMASLKPVLDALSRTGWIVDDSPEWIDLFSLQEKDPKRRITQISVEPA